MSSHIGYDKPRSELYEYAKKEMGYPQTCYMVDDNPIADICGANQANIHSIYVRGACADAEACIQNLADIFKIIK